MFNLIEPKNKFMKKRSNTSSKMKERDLETLERLFIENKGRGFKPSSMRIVAIKRGIACGYLETKKSAFFSYRQQETHIDFTIAGRNILTARLAERHRMDEDDALHLVRTGSFHLASTAVQKKTDTCLDNISQSFL
jgi:hypothetical protein